MITGALVLDHWGVVKADIGVRDGRIVGLGKAGNPDITAPQPSAGSSTRPRRKLMGAQPGRQVSDQHELRITVTRNGDPQFVLVSVDDLEGLDITLEVLSDEGAVGRIAESLASLESGDPGVTVAELRADLARRRAGA